MKSRMLLRFWARLDVSGRTGNPRATKPRAHRSVFLNIAARCDLIFPLGCWAPDVPSLIDASLSRSTFDPIIGQGESIHEGGRGLTLQAAFESCIGEIVERHAILPRQDELRRPVRVRSLASEEEALVPPDLVFTPPGVVGKGSAVGTTAENALCGALLELIERNAVARWWSEQVRRPGPQDTPFPDAVFGDERRVRRLLDLTMETGVPVTGAVSSTEAGDGIVMGAAAAFRARSRDSTVSSRLRVA